MIQGVILSLIVPGIMEIVLCLEFGNLGDFRKKKHFLPSSFFKPWIASVWIHQTLSLQQLVIVSRAYLVVIKFYTRLSKPVLSKRILHSIQTMNVCQFNGVIIFMSWKIEHSIQQGEAELNRMFNLSTNASTFIICFT